MSSVSTEKLGVDGEVVGRIVRTGAGPEAAMQAFAKSWRREA
jgi:hypothetical protein